MPMSTSEPLPTYIDHISCPILLHMACRKCGHPAECIMELLRMKRVAHTTWNIQTLPSGLLTATTFTSKSPGIAGIARNAFGISSHAEARPPRLGRSIPARSASATTNFAQTAVWTAVQRWPFLV
eukprot:3129751-Heterocapsa_arctica.AAC.1